MHRAARVVLWALGVAMGLLFLKEMLGHFSSGASEYPGNWTHPATLPAALEPPARSPLADSLAIAVAPLPDAGDTLFTADITVTNRSAVRFSRIVLGCGAVGEDGAITGRVAAILDAGFPPHSATRVPGVALHFVHRPVAVRCDVTGTRSP